MNILLVGFDGSRNSSKLLLDLIAPRYYQDKLYLDTLESRAIEEVFAHMERKPYEYVIFFSMKEEVQGNEIGFVRNAAKNGDVLSSNFPYDEMIHFLSESQVSSKVEEGGEESLANTIYYGGLEYMKQKQLGTKCILIKLPVITKMDVMELSSQITKYFSILVKGKQTSSQLEKE